MLALRLALEWFLDNPDKIANIEEFEYPTYAGLPLQIMSNLSPDDVDDIQNNWEYIRTQRFKFIERIYILPQ